MPNLGDVVSTAPDGRLSGVLPRIQASKSMQNLEQVNPDENSSQKFMIDINSKM